MLFNSYIFIFIFLPLSLIGYYLFRRYEKWTLSKCFLVVMSLYFYAYFRFDYLPLILSSIVINYALGKKLGLCSEYKTKTRKFWLVIGIIFNLGLLGVFKYLDFTIENINCLLGTSFPLQKIMLPLGISFYTFQQLSYLIDTYQGTRCCDNFIDYALFVTFFPQLIAGPIVLPQEMLPQFARKDSSSAQKAEEGLFLFGCGLVKKCFIADAIAVFANVGFDSTTTLTCGEAWLVSIAYTMQLYFDFSGYCDMAMGIGRFFGIDLPLNFNSPYKSLNFQDFWRRWHITLGRFLMNYLYIPLGGNRKGELRTLLNLLIVFLASGLWHGAGWTFVIWGLLHGLCILIHRIWSRKVSARLHFSIPRLISWGMTFFFINLFWIFFRANTLTRAMEIIRSMFTISRTVYLTPEYMSIIGVSGMYAAKILFFILGLAVYISLCAPNTNDMIQKINHRYLWIFNIALLFLGILCIGQDSPFLYFNF